MKKTFDLDFNIRQTFYWIRSTCRLVEKRKSRCSKCGHAPDSFKTVRQWHIKKAKVRTVEIYMNRGKPIVDYYSSAGHFRADDMYKSKKDASLAITKAKQKCKKKP
jgi:hypothetical protein